MKKLNLVLFMLMMSVLSHGQGVRYPNIVLTHGGYANPTIRVCTEPATGTPCTPLANIFQDPALSIPLSNPFTGDANGNFAFFAAPQITYHVQISGNNLVGYDIPYVSLPNGAVGSGTVVQVNVGNATPLFTANVSNPTTTPTISFSTPITGFQGNSNVLLEAGTISGSTGSTLCTDASGNATTVGCAGGSGGVTGSGTSGIFPIWTGTTAIGNSVLSNVSGSPAGINYSLGGGQSWQIDSSHITFNSGVQGSGNVVIANTFAPASGFNAGGINIVAANATGSACSGTVSILGGSTNGTNNSSLLVGGGCSNGFGATGANVIITAGSTTASNTGGTVQIINGKGNFGNGTIQLGAHNGAPAVVLWNNGSSGTFTEQLPATISSSWSFTWPNAVPTVSGQALVSTTAGVSSWSSNVPTATALASAPSQCSSGFVATGIAANGNANCTSGIAIQSASTTTITGNVSLTASTNTTVITKTVTMPSTGCPCRVFAGYTMYLAGTNASITDAWVDDGTSQFAQSEVLVTGSASHYGTSASSFSSATYSNSANVTFNLVANTSASGNSAQFAPNVGPQNSWLNLVVIPGN